MPEYKVWRIVAIVFLFITCLNVLNNMRFRIIDKEIKEIKTEIAQIVAESGDSGDVDK